VLLLLLLLLLLLAAVLAAAAAAAECSLLGDSRCRAAGGGPTRRLRCARRALFPARARARAGAEGSG
jgi:hypothetical protein